jgi:deoxycytidylate deaminase
MASNQVILNGTDEQIIKKRSGYLEWDEYFMGVAFLSAQRSKDPSSQVGACVVNCNQKIVGIGYNGMPNGCSDDELPWNRKAKHRLDTKYPYGKCPMIHPSDHPSIRPSVHPSIHPLVLKYFQ